MGAARTYALLVLVLCVAVACLAAARTAAARRSPGAGPVPQPVVLASDDGLTLVGRIGALTAKGTPQLDDLSRDDAAGLARLPAANLYFRGAVCRCRWRFRSPVLLTFELPKAIFAHTSLPLYRLQDGRWRLLRRRAEVGAVNATATATIVRPGSYALCLTRAWRTAEQDGRRLVVYTRPYRRTALLSPAVLASGSPADPDVIEAVMDVAHQTGDQARATLVSFATTSEPVRVVRLTRPSVMLRTWSGSSLVGRWFAPSSGGVLPGPDEARAIYALPAENLAVDVTLHRVKPGTALVTGVCSDMTQQPGYGPWATGGGWQLFGPLVSTYPPPAYDPDRIEIVSELRWEESELEAIDW